LARLSLTFFGVSTIHGQKQATINIRANHC